MIPSLRGVGFPSDDFAALTVLLLKPTGLVKPPDATLPSYLSAALPCLKNCRYWIVVTNFGGTGARPLLSRKGCSGGVDAHTFFGSDEGVVADPPPAASGRGLSPPSASGRLRPWMSSG